MTSGHIHIPLLIPLNTLEQAYQCELGCTLNDNCNKDKRILLGKIYLVGFLPSVKK